MWIGSYLIILIHPAKRFANTRSNGPAIRVHSRSFAASALRGFSSGNSSARPGVYTFTWNEFKHGTPSRPLAPWGPDAAGFLAGAFCSWLLFPLIPTRHVLSWVALWNLAVRCTMPVFLASGAAAWIAARAMSESGERAAINRAIGVACAASWIPPIVIFFAQRSPGCALLAVGLAVALCRAILLRSAPPRDSRPGIFPAVFIAGCVQAGLAGAAISDWRIAAIALALASSVLTWLLTAAAVWPHPALRNRRPRRIRLVPAFLLAVTFSAGGLSSYLARGGGGGAGWMPGQPAEEAKTEGKGSSSPYRRDRRILSRRHPMAGCRRKIRHAGRAIAIHGPQPVSEPNSR